MYFRYLVFKGFLEALIDENNIDKAIEVATTTNQSREYDLIKIVSEALIKRDYINKALEVVYAIPDQVEKIETQKWMGKLSCLTG